MKIIGKNISINSTKKKDIKFKNKKIGSVNIIDETSIPIDEPFNIEADGNKVDIPDIKKVLKSRKFGQDRIDGYIRIKKLPELVRLNNISIEDRIIYIMDIRGFTASKTSKVKNKSTFISAVDKLDYIESLGFNTVELMPIYEFSSKIDKDRINYWGYTPKAHYYAVNPAYGIKDEIYEFRKFVSECHKRNIAVIMQMFFENKSKEAIEDILSYWIYNFGIDGFRIIGTFNDEIQYSPYLTNSLLFINQSNNTNAISYNDEFLYNIRNFLLGNKEVTYHIFKHITDYQKRVNYIANVDGFSLRDVFSFVDKHNEENNEKNCDGPKYNISQNFGIEGITKDSYINDCRIKMTKIALAILFLSKGLPALRMGDEVYTTKNGNNNSYLLDDERVYLNFNPKGDAIDILNTIKELIYIRKDIIINNSSKEKNKTGISFHSNQAWIDPVDCYDESMGIYFDYEKEYFIAINMSRNVKKIAVPKGDMELIFNTGDGSTIDGKFINISPMSISIYGRKE